MKRLITLLFLFTLFFNGKEKPIELGPVWYWVDGTGDWDDTDNSHWADASGGVGGTMPVPTVDDNVIFDGFSGGGTVTVITGATCSGADFTDYTGTLAGTGTLRVGGDLRFDPSMAGVTWTGTLECVNGGYTNLISAGFALGPLYIGASSTVLCVDQATFNGDIVIDYGTFEAADNITANHLLATTTDPKSITLYGGTVRFLGSGTVWDLNPNDLSFYQDAATTIRFNDNSATDKNFYGGGATYTNVRLTGGSGAGYFNFYGSNTYYDLYKGSNNSTVILFEPGTTQTITGSLSFSGGSGVNNFISTIGGAATHALVNATGAPITLINITVSWSAATPGCPNAFIASTGSTNSRNNSGWIFGASCPAAGTSSLDAAGNLNYKQ